jgi:hypothetical protein
MVFCELLKIRQASSDRGRERRTSYNLERVLYLCTIHFVFDS